MNDLIILISTHWQSAHAHAYFIVLLQIVCTTVNRIESQSVFGGSNMYKCTTEMQQIRLNISHCHLGFEQLKPVIFTPNQKPFHLTLKCLTFTNIDLEISFNSKRTLAVAIIAPKMFNSPVIATILLRKIVFLGGLVDFRRKYQNSHSDSHYHVLCSSNRVFVFIAFNMFIVPQLQRSLFYID